MQSNTMAADALDMNDFVNANFNLLAETDELNDVQLDEEISPEEMEQVQNAIQDEISKEMDERSSNNEEFEGQLRPARHVMVSSARVDEYAHDSHAPATHTQSKWAVNIFRGKLNTF